MDDDERSKTVECLTRIINDEMGLREQLEIIRILNSDTKLKPTDTQFVIGNSSRLNIYVLESDASSPNQIFFRKIFWCYFKINFRGPTWVLCQFRIRKR